MLITQSSCQASYGEKYTLGNLEIYFTDEISDDYVKKTGRYFEKNGLIHDKKYSIQLTSSSLGSDKPGFILKMVLSEGNNKLPESELNNLKLLEEDIKKEVFNNENFSIMVCNENFNEIK